MDSRKTLESTTPGLPDLSVPHSFFRARAAPFDPGEPDGSTRCVTAGAGLILFDGLAALTWCNEADSGSLIVAARALRRPECFTGAIASFRCPDGYMPNESLAW